MNHKSATEPSGSAPNAIRIDADANAVIARDFIGQLPDANGLLMHLELILPAWKKCCYYAPFQRHAINPDLDLWPEGYNQCHPLPLRSQQDLLNAKTGGMFAVFELEDGRFLALLPLVDMQVASWLHGSGTALQLESSHFGSSSHGIRGEVPLLSCACAASVYEACTTVWEQAMAHPLMQGVGKLRTEKKYPEAFEYLGWCSFEEFKLNIDEGIIIEALRSCAKSRVPVRWVLIDDGHIDDCSKATDAVLQTQEGDALPGQGTDVSGVRRLYSEHPHAGKFPNGWKAITDVARSDPRLNWIGLWFNFNGYWGGIAEHHSMGADLDSHLILLETDSGPMKLPGARKGDADAFYDVLTGPAAEAGFDFIKVDNQAANLHRYWQSSGLENAVVAAAGCKQGLDRVVQENFSGIIGCMAHNNVCILHQPVSQLIRCSEDYKKEDPWRAKHHLHNSFGNMLWMGQTVWGDHDMFHSSDKVAAAMMARSKAISGGPVYLSDHPDNFCPEQITPLCFSDGRIPRALAPAVPLPESIFIDPYEDDQAYRVIAPLGHGCAALAAYNLTHPDKPVHGSWSRNDLKWRGAMLPAGQAAGSGALSPGNEQKQQPDADNRVLLYNVVTKEATLLDDAQPSIDYTLPQLSDMLVILSPLRHGWAVIGNPDKYITVGAVAEFKVSADGRTATVTAVEDSELWLWHERSGIIKLHAKHGVPQTISTSGEPVSA